MDDIIPNVTMLEPGPGEPKLHLARKKSKAGRKVVITHRHVRAAKNLLSGTMSRKQALIDAGYSANTARIPSATIRNSPALIAALKAELAHYQAPAEERATIIRNRLVREILTAKSGDAIRACEVAGKDREVQLFQPETTIGIFTAVSSDKLLTLVSLATPLAQQESLPEQPTEPAKTIPASAAAEPGQSV